MPYIVKEMRTMIDQRATNVLSLVGQLYPGELSYLLTQVVLHWINVDPRPDYARLASVSGVLTETLAELRRRVIVPYEEARRQQNGDVFGS